MYNTTYNWTSSLKNHTVASAITRYLTCCFMYNYNLETPQNLIHWCFFLKKQLSHKSCACLHNYYSGQTCDRCTLPTFCHITMFINVNKDNGNKSEILTFSKIKIISGCSKSPPKDTLCTVCTMSPRSPVLPALDTFCQIFCIPYQIHAIDFYCSLSGTQN